MSRFNINVPTLTDDQPKATHPADFGSITLYPYQLSSIHRMREMEAGTYSSEGNNVDTVIGIEASKVGSGKTLTCIGLVRSETFPQPLTTNETFWESSEKVCITVKNNLRQRMKACPTTLIVVPHNLVGQWENEMKRSNTSYELSRNINPRGFDFEKSPWPVILCSSSIYNDWINNVLTHAGQIMWHRAILDEADNNLIPAMKPLFARFIWFVTYTFQNLFQGGNIRRRGFIHDMFKDRSMQKERIFRSIVVRNNDDYIDAYINLPPIITKKIKCKTPSYISVANKYITGNIASMINAGNIADAITALGGDVMQDNDIIKVFIKNKQNDIDSIKHKIENISILYPRLTKKEKEEKIEVLERKIKEIEDLIDNVTNDIDKLKDASCPICECEYENAVLIDCCHTIFCLDCIEQCLNATRGECPQCMVKNLNMAVNIKIVDKDLKKVDTPKPDAPIPGELQSKEQTIVDIVKGNKETKTIVFSSHNQSFQLIKNTLAENNITFAELKGTLSQYEKLISDYNSGKLNVLMLNSEHCGAGLNLTLTTDLVIYHKMPALLEKQLVGRGQRIGRTDSLRVHMLYYSGEYEETD